MSTGHIPVSLQRRVRLRASERCEYCRIAQVGQEATFHVDHVVPQAAGGVSSLGNLALACVSCSLRKGARTTAIDPVTAMLHSCSTLGSMHGATTSWPMSPVNSSV
jgi:5-methylcytosine-specific restriction endonuclease McrA